MDNNPAVPNGNSGNTPNQNGAQPMAANPAMGAVNGGANMASAAAANAMPNMAGQAGAAAPNPAPAAHASAIPSWMNNPNNNPDAMGMPVGSVVEPAVSKKKKGPGLIIAIVLIVLLLLVGGGVAAWYFLIYNSPEHIAYDAISGFLTEKNITVTGNIWNEQYHYDDTGERIGLELTSSQNAPLSGTAEMVLQYGALDEKGEIDSERNLELKIGSTVMSDGVFYVRVDNLRDAYDRINRYEEAGGAISCTEYADEAEALECIDEVTDIVDDDIAYISEEGDPEEYVASIWTDLINDIDGQWWRISLPDIIDMIAKQVDDIEVVDRFDYVKEFYKCMVGVANKDIRGEIANLYGANRFVNITKADKLPVDNRKAAAGNTFYEISYDYEKMATFVNALLHTDFVDGSFACYNDLQAATSDYEVRKLSALDFEEYTAEDLQEQYGKVDKIYLEISNHGHQLKGIFQYVSEEKSKRCIDLHFDYSPVSVAAPSEYRPITDLLEDLISSLTSMLQELAYSSIYGYGGEDWDFDYDDDDWAWDADEDTVWPDEV